MESVSISCRDLPLGSGIQKLRRPAHIRNALSRTSVPGRPINFVREPNVIVVNSAPIFPAAADNPCPVARKRVGKTSAGNRKVVVLGPQFKKNCQNPGVSNVQIWFRNL